MSKKTYKQLMDNIKVTDEVVDKAVESIYCENCNIVAFRTKNNKKLAFVSTAVVALFALILVGIFSIATNTSLENSFIINVGASEINSFNAVEIGELKGSNNAYRMLFNSPKDTFYIAQSKITSFPIMCKGNNIDKINYEIIGDGYFALSNVSDGITDKVYVPEKPDSFDEAEKYVYNIANTGKYTEKVLSFTVDYESQSENTAILGLYTIDDDGEYVAEYNDKVYYDEKTKSYIQGKDLDYTDMYYNIFNKSNHSVKITVTFEDGTTEIKTLNLSLEKLKKSYESGEKGEYIDLKLKANIAE